jgi:hypothetical protein
LVAVHPSSWPANAGHPQLFPRRAALLCLVAAFGFSLPRPALAEAFITSIPPQVPDPPPLKPDGEAVVPDDPKFRESCLALIPTLRKNIRIERMLTTDTRHWGTVLRVDFSMLAGERPTEGGSVNRLVFWDGPGGTPFILIAVGQPIPPLP